MYVHAKFGSYCGPVDRYRDPNILIDDHRKYVILTGLSENKRSWKGVLDDLETLHWSFDHLDKDFDPASITPPE